MSDPRSRSIAVVIVNYGTADLAIAAVESVLSYLNTPHLVEVHLLDNASPNNDAEIFRQTHSERNWGERVILHFETQNHGFGRGNNVVLETLRARQEQPDYVFLLNPDAQLENDVLSTLVARVEADPKIGIAGAGIALPNGQAVTAAFRFPTPKAEFAHAVNFGPVSRLFAGTEVALPPDHPEGPVDWVAGAAVLIRFSVLLDIGFFNPVYFLYFEEVDLMRRARQAGWEILYVPEARVIHAEGAATDQKSNRAERRRRPEYWYESWRHYYLGNHGRRGAIRAGLAWMAGAALNYPLALLRGQEISAPKYFFPDFWRLVMRPLIAGHSRNGSTMASPVTKLRSDPVPEGVDTALFDPNPGVQNCNPADISLIALIREDFRTHDSKLFSQGFWALFWHRFGNWRMGLSKPLRIPATLLYRMMAKATEWMAGVHMPYTVRVGRRVRLEHFGGMILVAQSIGNDVVIRQNTTFGIAGLSGLQNRPVIGNGVEIGTGAVIVGSVHVGDGAVIGANAVVTRDIPAGAVAGGVPARILRIATPEDPESHD